MLPALFDHLWQSTLFALVAGLLTLALRKNRARVRHGIWLAASCKFLVPVSVLIALGGQIEWRNTPAPANISVVMDEVSQPFTTAPAALPVIVPASASRLPEVLFAIWACGSTGPSRRWSRSGSNSPAKYSRFATSRPRRAPSWLKAPRRRAY